LKKRNFFCSNYANIPSRARFALRNRSFGGFPPGKGDPKTIFFDRGGQSGCLISVWSHSDTSAASVSCSFCYENLIETDSMKLHFVIPAYNEEQSIEGIIERSLAARQTIISNSPVDEVEITVVSDGSNDRTVEIAQRYADQIKLIVFEKNRGYGAAIKEGWRQSDADFLGFLDADGTCDPNFFATLCQALERDKSDVALGNRMHMGGKMPLVRRIGNFIFAGILTMFSSEKVQDTASGMRVIRRSCLPKLIPLPDGMAFTPAISARAILDQDLKVSEMDMPYHEREGTSKLKVWKDGVRFLKVICEAAFLYRPSRPLELLGIICLIIATSLMIFPIHYYLKTRTVAEWMIYRFVVSNLLGTTACLLFCASYLSRRIVDMVLFNKGASRRAGLLSYFINSSLLWYLTLALFLIGGLLVMPSFKELLATGATNEHWSRFIAMSFMYAVGIILIVTKLIDYSLTLLAGRLEFLRELKVNRK
jgi:glycosyltransferase involved in cell wall biosynthesis